MAGTMGWDEVYGGGQVSRYQRPGDSSRGEMTEASGQETTDHKPVAAWIVLVVLVVAVRLFYTWKGKE